jgi:HPr kinase/phosphorylase
METIHATTVVIEGIGVLLRGRSGSGKSDLALRLIDGGARLVADDQTILKCCDGRLEARAPGSLQNKIEVRNLGVLTLPVGSVASVGVLGLVVDLVDSPDKLDRMPVPETVDLNGIAVRRLRLWPFEASAAAKVRLAIRVGADNIET